MDKRVIKDIARIAEVPEELVSKVLSVELLFTVRQLIRTKGTWANTTLGNIVKPNPEKDIFELKVSQDLLDMMEGKINPELLEGLTN